MKKVWFIRHGESEANAGLATLDHAQITLTAKGHAQAKQLRELFPAAPDLIVTSPFLRTKQTAQPLLDTFPRVPHIEWQIHEFTFLASERLGLTTYQERLPLVETYWQTSDPFGIDGQGTESFAQFIARVQSVLDRLHHMPEQEIVVFTHGYVMYAVLWLTLVGTLEMESSSMSRFRMFTTSFSIPNTAAFFLHYEQDVVLASSLMTSHIQAPSL
jgi:2,3-bisphosphoglycerate-dependent phosphoglycerate mutase